MANTPQVPVAELEFEHSPFEDALIRHRRKLILVASLAVVGTLGYFGSKLWKDHQHSVAALAFTRAQTVGEYRTVAGSHPGQAGGGSALIEASRLLALDGKGREAIDELEKFLKGWPQHELVPLAEFRLADLKLQEGGAPDAAERFLKISKDTKSPFAALALLRAADIRWQEGKNDEAKKMYEEVGIKGVGGQLFEISKQRIKELHLVAPTMIDYVPPEPTPEAGTPGTPGIPGLNTAPPSADALQGLNSPGLLGEDPVSVEGAGDSLLPPPALPQSPPAVVPQVPPAVTPPPPVPEKPAE